MKGFQLIVYVTILLGQMLQLLERFNVYIGNLLSQVYNLTMSIFVCDETNHLNWASCSVGLNKFVNLILIDDYLVNISSCRCVCRELHLDCGGN